jgi:hypothetical protein
VFNRTALLLASGVLAAAPVAAGASTRIACDWAGTIASEPQSQRLHVRSEEEHRDFEIDRITFRLVVSRFAASQGRRNDTSCSVPDEAVEVRLDDVPFDRRKGDTVRVRYLYVDDAGNQGSSWFELIDCRHERSLVCQAAPATR